MKVSLQKQVVGLIWPKEPQFASPALAQFRVFKVGSTELEGV